MQFLPLLCGISVSVAMTSLPLLLSLSRSLSVAPRGVGSIKRAPSTVILRLLRIATPEMAYAEMDGLPLGSFAWTRRLLLAAAAAATVIVVVVSARLPINPIISCKAMRCCWLDFPVRHDIS